VDLVRLDGRYNEFARFMWMESFLASRETLGFSRKTSWSGVCVLGHKNTKLDETNFSTTFILITNLEISSKTVTGKYL
jgi:hypothetical protein